jgi:hypothetical protein
LGVQSPKALFADTKNTLGLSDKLGVLELIVWDKDTFGKDYLGEVGIPLEAWFVDQQQDEEGEGRTVKRTLDWESSKNGVRFPFSPP